MVRWTISSDERRELWQAAGEANFQMKFDYDLFVIGGGSGGVRASRMASLTGARVALAEEWRMGGTCVIRGCIPKKLLVYASQFSENVQDAAGYGWGFGRARVA